jgi:serine phosphatase RsbU (regulator of sigma subunit)
MSMHRPPTSLLVLGLAAFSIAALSIVDMYLPRPYDGVVLESGTGRPPVVQAVVAGSGAERAGIASGDAIIGIGSSILTTKANAAQILNEREIGERVPYLVRRPVPDGYEQWEVMVELGRRQIGDTSYLYALLLGFSFFFIGLFVLLHQPGLRAGHVFFLLCSLFLLFLVCRLRPASYSWVDTVVLRTGTLALVLLPASFLHFFLIFPRPVWDGRLGAALAALRRRRVWTAVLAVLYLVPVAVLLAGVVVPEALGREVHLINGAPAANWWVLAGYVLVGLGLLTANWARLPASGERRGAALVLAGTLVGMLPFLVLAVGFPSFLDTERFVFYGVVPMVAIPLTFAYAIFRFQLLDVRVILRKSLLYTATTAVVTVVYALAIASFNAIFRGTRLADTAYFPLLFALAIVLLFEPLRRRIQGPMDRFFFAERTRLQKALVEMGEAFTGQGDPAAVVGELVGRLPELLGVRYSVLYLHRGQGRYERTSAAAGEGGVPVELPVELEVPPALESELVRRGGLARLDELNLLRLKTAAVDRLAGRLAEAGVEVVGVLASSRRRLGLLVLAQKAGNVVIEPEELELLRGLCHQAAIALETSRLLDERARQAELERDLEIASTIQRSLLPRGLELGPGWEVATACRPARHVGGDFYAMLPGPHPDSHALVYGDVAGKSIPGALMMMAASEVLHSLALTHRDPEELFRLANRRLYEIGGRSFVAVGYFAPGPNGDGCLSYLLAGQPSPLKRSAAGGIEELPFPEHRLPLGALDRGGFRSLNARLDPGDLVLAYSDGVVEAQSPAGELFGQQRLEAVLGEAPGEPQQVIDRVLAELDRFTAGLDPYDDVTLLALGRAAAGAGVEMQSGTRTPS